MPMLTVHQCGLDGWAAWVSAVKHSSSQQHFNGSSSWPAQSALDPALWFEWTGALLNWSLDVGQALQTGLPTL